MKSVKKSVAFIMAGLFVTGTGFVLASTTLSAPAQAQSRDAKQVVDQAKKAGIIGETAGGYLDVVNGQASPEIIDSMNEINIGRRSVYSRLAEQKGVGRDVVEVMAGEKQLAKAVPGEKVMNKSGNWVEVK